MSEPAPDLKPYTLQIRGGSALWTESAPPGYTGACLPIETHLTVWISREHEWLVAHALRFWTQVSVHPINNPAPVQPGPATPSTPDPEEKP